MNTVIRKIQASDLPRLDQALRKHDIRRQPEYFKYCMEENESNRRVTFIAVHGDEYAGFVHLLSGSKYPHFNKNNIPEINDLVVFPPYRKRGIAGALMDAAEEYGFAEYDEIGLGVGLYSDYGDAQRLYMKRGYIADGNGLHYKHERVEPGRTVTVDDDLLVYLTKVGRKR